MSINGRLIERYLLAAVLPYLLLALALLTTILFAQQSSRFAELLLTAHIQSDLAAHLALALVPNVLVFTLPMATLAGILIGFSRLGSDSELIAMRAAGIGTWRLLQPVLLVGLVVTVGAAYINLELAPQSARSLRQTLMRTAISKLDSPVDPGTFNTEIPNDLIYVRDGDKESGRWGRVFIYSEDAKTNSQRIVTARSGRIDSAAEQSELVLTDAVSIELPAATALNGSYVSTHLQQLRLQLDTGRKALLEKLSGGKLSMDEMNWSELKKFAANKNSAAARDAATLQQKRVALSLTPLAFALLGASLGLRIKKGGRGAGVLLSLGAMIAYYMVALIGEQMSRAGTLPPAIGMWIATMLILACSLLLLFAGRFKGLLRILKIFSGSKSSVETAEKGSAQRASTPTTAPAIVVGSTGPPSCGSVRLLSFPSLLDVSIVRALTTSFVFTLTALTAVFLIFTLFELWRAIIENNAGIGLVARYLLFLLPFVSVQIMPASVLLAMLVTYALLARRSEAIAWWAGGQSIYRLILPGVLFAVFVTICSWIVQERLMPQANRRQDELRARIKHSALRTTTPVGRQWLASSVEAGPLYAYEFEEESNSLGQPSVYEFDAEGVHLKRIVQGKRAVWSVAHQLQIADTTILDLSGEKIQRGLLRTLELNTFDGIDAFKPTLNNPSQLSASQLSSYIKRVRLRGDSARILLLALQAKYADPFGSLVIALVGIPLALSFGKRSAVTALCVAVAIGLAFLTTIGGFHRLGTYGLLPVSIAAWSPVAIFASIGGYLLARVRT